VNRAADRALDAADWLGRQCERLGWYLRRGKEPPVITSQYGQTTESARLACALRMRDDPEVKERVERACIDKFGGLAMGLAYARRTYPEAYERGD
jgi:hypothetical protein